jgi:hypothetical protein
MSLLGIFNSLGYCGKFGHLADEITNSLRALQRLLVLFLQVTLDLVWPYCVPALSAHHNVVLSQVLEVSILDTSC